MDDGLWFALLGIRGGERLRLDIDGTRVGLLTCCAAVVRDGGLWTLGSATLDNFARTRMFAPAGDLGADDTVDETSSTCNESADRAGDEAVLNSV